MKKLFAAIMAGVLMQSTVYAETIYENTVTTPITTGLTHQSIDIFTDTGWRKADVLRVDLTDENLELKVLTSPDGTAHLSTVKDMAEHYGTKAAVNADFFNVQSGETNMLGMVYQNGELISTPSKDNFVSFAVTENNEVIFDYFTFKGTLYAENTSLTEYAEGELYQINKVPVTNGGITMITSAWGDGVTVPDYTYAMVCEPGEEADTYRMTGFSWGAEKVIIPEGGAVFTANYSVNAFLNANFAIGDIIRVETSISPDTDAIYEASGGNTLIVKDGEVCEFTSNITGKAQRTAMGLSKSGKTLVLVTVDGRQTDCKGFDQTELAEFMIALGCDSAINLDGGGSTTMVTENRFTGEASITNEVSTPRKVSTAIGILSYHDFTDPYEADMKLSSDTIIPGDSVSVSSVFYDENYNILPLEEGDVKIYCSDVESRVEENSVTLSSPGTHTIRCEYDGIYVEKEITVLDDIFAINIYPESVSTIEKDRSFTVTAYDKSGFSAAIPPSLVNFEVTGDVTMDKNTAKKGEGSGTVTAVYNSLTSTAVVNGNLYDRPEDISIPDTFEGFIEDGEKITITGFIEEPSNLIGRFSVKERLSDLITRGDVYALSSENYDPWDMFTVYRKTDGFTERVIDDTKVITLSNTVTNSIRLTDSTAWGKIKTVCETITQKNIVFIMNKPIYSSNQGERLVWDYYMKMLTDKGVNVFVVSSGTKSEATVENGVRYLYIGSVGECDNQSFEYSLNASKPLTISFSSDEIRYTFENPENITTEEKSAE
ncbi:MAG: phosphodiester glycosidase family protein [Clostridia bacterium]|nr:phosphodiester glycosidase family protein [Clostridia bacterium]